MVDNHEPRRQPWAEPGTNQAMFERVARRYDRLNRLMSLGRDQAWRRELVAEVAPRPIDLALDIGAGTADLALALAGRARLVVAADLTPGMLQAASPKLATHPRGPWVRPVLADALRLPFPDETFDCVVSGFVLRNLVDLPAAFAEWLRVLKPGGRVGAVEMTHPPGRGGKALQALQLRLVAPILARLAGSRSEDYQYIARSLRAFPDAPELAGLMADGGLRDVRYRHLMFGSVAVHAGEKPG